MPTRRSVGAQWPFLSDPERTVQKDPEHDPMIPHTLVLKPGLVVHSIYNGYWFWGRPSVPVSVARDDAILAPRERGHRAVRVLRRSRPAARVGFAPHVAFNSPHRHPAVQVGERTVADQRASTRQSHRLQHRAPRNTGVLIDG